MLTSPAALLSHVFISMCPYHSAVRALLHTFPHLEKDPMRNLTQCVIDTTSGTLPCTQQEVADGKVVLLSVLF